MDNAPDDELSGQPSDAPAHPTDFADELDALAVIEAELAAAEAELDALDADAPVAD